MTVTRSARFTKAAAPRRTDGRSSLQDADEATAITQMTQAQTQMQAALAAQAKLPHTTLFDLLPNG